MAEAGISGATGMHGETLLNIFPNPCKGDTFLYTDDLEAAFIQLFDSSGQLQAQWPITAGKTLHIDLDLEPGTYHVVLINHFYQGLGKPKALYISEIH